MDQSKVLSAKEESVPFVEIEFIGERAKKAYNNVFKPQTSGSAGIDLKAMIDRPITLSRLRPFVISTGIKAALPEGYELQIRSRSGLAAQGIVVSNSPGTIDSDYRGEIKVILHSITNNAVVRPGDRIAQAVLQAVPKLDFTVVQELTSKTERGEGGFGSTG